MSQICRPSLCVLAALAVGACAPIAASEGTAADGFGDAAGASPPAASRECAGPQGCEATAETASCPADTIVFVEGERCASCSVTEGSVEVCGPQQLASCFELELGEVCQRCVTSSGEVLYDDCVALTEAVAALTCEQVTLAGESPETCEVCRDQNGVVVQQTCGRGALRCEELFEAGQACEVCRDDAGTIVTRSCDPPDLDPAYCMAYGDDDGRCVDCYDSAGALLRHDCTLTPNPLLDAGVAPDGAPVESTVGTDVEPSRGGPGFGENPEAGDAVDVVEGERCELLSFEAQECRVCVGGDGRELSTRCRPLDEGAATPSCAVSYDPAGNLCRTCPIGDGGGGDETLCLEGGEFLCRVEASYDDEDTDLPRLCTRCDVAGGVVYEACALGSAPATPLCEADVTVTGDACERCFLEERGEVVYSSCGN